MLIKGNKRASTLAACLAAAPDHHLKQGDPAALIEHQVAAIAHCWQSICEAVERSAVDWKLFAGRQFLNGYARDGRDGQKLLCAAFGSAQSAPITRSDL